MDNPWKQISLDDYENHMRLDSVMQLQSMNAMMQDQFSRYPVSTVMVLGIAGGNGLNHVRPGAFTRVYGVDINPLYLEECVNRYPLLRGVFQPVEADLLNPAVNLPGAGLVIANLLVEYIGYAAFQRVIRKVKPKYVSCVIQINTGAGFVSDSPYLHAFDRLDEVHHQMDPDDLSGSMNAVGYRRVFECERELPNGKKLARLDYQG
jgi:hypothetical protein